MTVDIMRPYARAHAQVFVRGSLLLLVADSPHRAQVLFCKAPNGSTRHPCPYCSVEQSAVVVGAAAGVAPDEDDEPDEVEGGELGDPQYDIFANRRTKEHLEEGRLELQALAAQPTTQNRRSMELGMVAPGAPDEQRPLFDMLDLDPLRHVPVEILHADALVRTIYIHKPPGLSHDVRSA